ncbi:hypothetical protein RSJ42_01140 [Methanosarcina hadiensis]|uniref:hypothetical protein n=1 Tax=Methanosarcina hadiensis TaxID=3078083 RepID=UPI0039776E3E
MNGDRKEKNCLINRIGIFIRSLPCALGFGPWSSFSLFEEGKLILDLEDFVLSYNLLPIGAIVFVLFCTRRSGWGWNSFREEADAGKVSSFQNGLNLM